MTTGEAVPPDRQHASPVGTWYEDHCPGGGNKLVMKKDFVSDTKRFCVSNLFKRNLDYKSYISTIYVASSQHDYNVGSFSEHGA